MGTGNRFEALAAPGVRSLAPYVPGKPPATLERELGIKGSIKLASNENPLGPGPRAQPPETKGSARTGLSAHTAPSFLDNAQNAGSPKSGWWWWQSSANPSPVEVP